MTVYQLKHIARSLGDCRTETNQDAVARSPVCNRVSTQQIRNAIIILFSSHRSSVRASLCQSVGADRLDCRRTDFMKANI